MRTKKIILNTIFSLIEEIVVIISTFIIPRLILSYFGSKYNGLITSITQFLSCAVILRSGIGGATRAALYKPLSENNKDEFDSIVKATDIFMKKIGGILLIIIIIFSTVYPFFVKNEFDWFFTFSLFLIIGINSFAESFFGITYLIILQADQKLWVASAIKSICNILNIVITSLLIINGFGIHIVKFASTIVFVISPIALNIYVTKKYKINKKAKPNNIALSQRWDAFWHQISTLVNNNTDVMVLTIFSNVYIVSVYSVYSLVINGLNRFVVAFTNGIEGSFGDMIAKKENKKLERNISIIELITQGISTIIYSSAIVLVLQFVSIYTKGITDVNYLQPKFSYVLLLAQFFYAIRLPYQFVIQAAGHFKQTKKYAAIEVIINIVLSVLMVIKFGIIGVAIGTLVAAIYKTISYSNYMSKNLIRRKISLTYVKSCVSLIEMFIIILAIKLINLPTNISYANWIINGIITIIIATSIVSIFSIILYRKDVKYLIEHFKMIIMQLYKKRIE